MPKPYPAAFRRQVLVLLDERRTVRDVASSLGSVELCLHQWKRQQRIEQELTSGTSDGDHRELATAKQRIRDLEEEVNIPTRLTKGARETRPVPHVGMPALR